MGGTVTVVSEKGVGTTFITEIPLKLDPAAFDAEKQEEEIDTTVFRGLHVLLVEDNEVNMEIAAFLLEDSGAEVTKAWNGAEGLEKFNASAPGTYDLILMDIMMPVMNGLEAAEKIRAARPPGFGDRADLRHDGKRVFRRRRPQPQSRYERAPHKAARP